MIIRWLDLAVGDLQQVREYIKRDNPKAANKIAKKILEAVDCLKDHPGMGRSGRIHGTRELIIANTPYIVPYRMKDNQIEILRVLHGSQMWPVQFPH